MRFNAVNDEKGMVNGEGLEEVDSFFYLGAKFTTSGGADDGIICRVQRLIN